MYNPNIGTPACKPLNVRVQDLDSVSTGYGKHNRVVAFHPQHDETFGCTVMYARVDHVNGLRDPSHSEVIAVARKKNGIKGRLTFLAMTDGANGCSTDLFFKLVSTEVRV